MTSKQRNLVTLDAACYQHNLDAYETLRKENVRLRDGLEHISNGNGAGELMDADWCREVARDTLAGPTPQTGAGASR